MNYARFAFATFVLTAVVATSSRSGETSIKQKPEDLAKARLELARRCFRVTESQIKDPPTGLKNESEFRAKLITERIPLWSRRWMDSQIDANEGLPTRIEAMAAHIERLKKYEVILTELRSNGESGLSQMDVDSFVYYRYEMEALLAKTKPSS